MTSNMKHTAILSLGFLSACFCPTETSAPPAPEATACPSIVEACQDLATWCQGGVYLWPHTPQDIAEYGQEPQCFCMCDDDTGCTGDGAPEGASCGVLLDGETNSAHFPKHTWFDTTFSGGRPTICLTDQVTPSPVPASCP